MCAAERACFCGWVSGDVTLRVMSVMNLFGGQGVQASGLVQALLGVELAAPILCVSGFGGFCGCAQKSLKRSATRSGSVCDEVESSHVLHALVLIRIWLSPVQLGASDHRN